MDTYWTIIKAAAVADIVFLALCLWQNEGKALIGLTLEVTGEDDKVKFRYRVPLPVFILIAAVWICFQ